MRTKCSGGRSRTNLALEWPCASDPFFAVWTAQRPERSVSNLQLSTHGSVLWPFDQSAECRRVLM